MDIHVVVEGQSFCVELPESECDVWKAIGDALLVETGLRAECFTTEAGLDGICAGDTVHLVTVQRLVARRELQAWGWGPDEWTIRLRKFAAEGDVEKVRLLVEAEIDDEESGVVPPKAPSPLFAACLNNHVEVVRLLLQGGASMEEGFGQAHASVLIAAALSSAEAIVLLLLEHGADPCAVSRVRDPVTDFSKHYTMPVGTLGRTTYLWMGATPVNVAARKGNVPILLALLKEIRNRGDVVKEVNRADVTGRTPLLLAAANGMAEVVKILVAAGAVVEPPATDPQVVADTSPYHPASPLEAAVEWRYGGMADYLVQHGANVNRINPQGSSLLAIASAQGNLTMVSFLLSHNADPNVGQNFDTPICAAVRKNSFDVVRALLDGGADPVCHAHTIEQVVYVANEGSVRRDESTWLRFKTWFAQTVLRREVRSFCERGIVTNTGTPKNMTPLGLAAYFDRIDMAHLLLETTDQPADIILAAFYVAQTRGSFECIAYLKTFVVRAEENAK